MKRIQLPLLLRCLGWFALFWLLLVMGALLAFLLLRGLPAINLSLFFGDTPVSDALLGLRPVW
ncbi:MAG: hypothetical protein ACRC5A_11900, partial [Enterobacteriaceae bacterium]